MKQPVLVFGAGGHAKVVIDILRAGTHWEPVAVADDNVSLHGGRFFGLPVMGGLHDAAAAAERLGISCFVVALGRNALRLGIAAQLQAQGLSAIAAVHPSAVIAPSVRIGAGTVVMAGVCINADTEIGEHVIINTRASIDHDCRIGDGAHIAPGVSLCGGVSVGREALVGVGSSVIPGKRIGACATIGAGSAVVADIPDGQVAAGAPARMIRMQA